MRGGRATRRRAPRGGPPCVLCDEEITLDMEFDHQNTFPDGRTLRRGGLTETEITVGLDDFEARRVPAWTVGNARFDGPGPAGIVELVVAQVWELHEAVANDGRTTTLWPGADAGAGPEDAWDAVAAARRWRGHDREPASVLVLDLASGRCRRVNFPSGDGAATVGPWSDRRAVTVHAPEWGEIGQVESDSFAAMMLALERYGPTDTTDWTYSLGEFSWASAAAREIWDAIRRGQEAGR